MNTYGIIIKNSVGGNFNNEELGFMRGVLAALGVGSVSENRFASDFTSFVFVAAPDVYEKVVNCLNGKKASFREMKVTLEFK